MGLRRFLLFPILLLLPCVASAREGWRDWCQTGNRHVITSGLSSTNLVQQSFPTCVVTIYVHGGGLATIYSDNNGTPLANPFTAQTNGQFIWFANDGTYDQTISGGGMPQPVTMSSILLCDPFVAGAVCSGASSGAHNLLSTTHLDTIPASPPVRGDLVVAQNQTSPTGVNPSWARLPLGTLNYVLTSNGTDAIWAPVAGGGCTLPGTDTGILTEHPVGTCYDSTHATWNDAVSSSTVNGQILLVGDGTNVATAPAGGNSLKETFVFGDTITITGKGASQIGQFMFGSNSTMASCSLCAAFGDSNHLGGSIARNEEYVYGDDNTVNGAFIYVLGDFNAMTGSDLLVVGEGNHLDSAGTGGTPATGITSTIVLEETATITLGGTNSTIVDTQILGSGDTFTVGNPTGGFTNQLNCLHGVGASNTFTLTGGLGSTHSIQNVSWVGKSNQFTATGFNISSLAVAGNSNTVTATAGTVSAGGMYGSSMTLAACSHCYAYGENVSLSTSSTVAMGISAAPELSITAGHVALNAHLDQTATGKFAGSCAMGAATTCTFAISAAFSGTPLCVTSIDAASAVPATANVAKCSVSGTTVTITAGISNSLTWDAILVGNPN